MPVLSIAIPELETHAFYPICVQSIHKVIESIGLEKLFKNNIFIETGFSQPKNFNDTKHNATLNINKVRAQAEINTNPANLKWEHINFSHALEPIGFSHTTKDRDFQVVFYDPDSNIKLNEMVLPTYISLNCTMSILDRSIAYQIPSLLYRHYPPNMPSMEHISYDYPIPKPTIALLYTLFKLKRFNKPLSFKDYLDKSTGNNTQIAINRVHTKEELVMKKILIDSLFMLDYSDNKPNEVVVNRSVNQYDINFTIHLQFTRPDTLIMDYPVVIDNQLLPGNLIPEVLHKSEPISNLIGPYPINILNEAVDHYQKKYIEPVMIKFPDYDEWYPPLTSSIIQRKYRPWFSCIFTMDEDSEYTELPIGGVLDEELGYELHPLVKEILKRQGSKSFDTDCIFNITIFNDDLPVEKSYLSINEDLTIKVRCIDPRKVRRLVISELVDISKLNPVYTEVKSPNIDNIVNTPNKDEDDKYIVSNGKIISKEDIPVIGLYKEYQDYLSQYTSFKENVVKTDRIIGMNSDIIAKKNITYKK